MKVILEKPVIIKVGGVKLQCRISGDLLNADIYYKFDESYEPFLTSDRLDAFLVTLLPYLMYRSSDNEPLELHCKAPISEKLLFQITQDFVPTITHELNCWYSPIKIHSDTTQVTFNPTGVGTGVSGGVDSFFTLLKSRNEFQNAYKVTHGVYYTPETRKSYKDVELSLATKICKELGLELIHVETNIIGSVYEGGHDAIISYFNASVPLTLQSLLKAYYISSSYTYSEFEFLTYAASHVDLFLAHCFSNENVSLYSYGSFADRTEKTDYISNDELVQKYLYVCGSAVDGKNCSKCAKCTRTMLDLEVLGKLDGFSDVFDVKKLRENPNYYWGYLFFKGKKEPFVKSTLKMAQKKGYKIPIMARLSGLIKIIKKGFKRSNPYKYSFRP